MNTLCLFGNINIKFLILLNGLLHNIRFDLVQTEKNCGRNPLVQLNGHTLTCNLEFYKKFLFSLF
jgi:hypothetical protein